MSIPHAYSPGSSSYVQAIVFSYNEKENATVELEFADGNISSFKMASNFVLIPLTELDPRTAKFIRDYARGKVTLQHIREALDLPKPETPIEAFSREAQRQLDRIVSKSLEEMRVTEESDVDLDEEFEHGSIYISLPSGASDATIQRVLREFHNAPEFSNCEITINVEGGR